MLTGALDVILVLNWRLNCSRKPKAGVEELKFVITNFHVPLMLPFRD